MKVGFRGRLAAVFTTVSMVLFASQAALSDEGGVVKPLVEEETNDPFESVNRVTAGFNRVVRGAVLDPVVDGYKAVTTEELQEAIGNAASNLTEPLTAVSSLLQGDTENAETATKRFFINSTMGLGGTSDPAADMGYDQRREDLGQAAAAGGTGAGPYIVLPILGPSNTRDALGDFATAVATPLPLAATVATSGVEYSNNKDEIDAATESALDPYVVEREAYRQHRQYQINNGLISPQDAPTFDED